jgi:uncharacterized protein (TIGR02246 family)
MTFKQSLAMLIVGLAMFSTGNVYSQDTGVSVNVGRGGDEQGVKEAIASFGRAFEAGEAEAAGRLLSSGSELVGEDGSIVRGRDSIQTALTSHFAANPRVKIESVSNTVRFPSRDTAAVEGLIRVVHPDSGTSHNRFEIHCVREDGKWLLSLIHEWPHEQAALLDLEWLIGTWKSKQENTEVETTYEWFGEKAFIRANFTIREKDKSYTGMQMIGVDRETGLLRTWIFEANGGVGEGLALQDAKQWVFESATELTSGDVLEATNILVRIDGNTFTWQPLDLSINGEQFGNLPPVKVTRVR